MRLRTLLLLATLLVATGCWRSPEPAPRFVPGEPLYQQYTSRGHRAVVRAPDGPILKLRLRSRSTRVYDELMRPLGQIVAADHNQITTRSLKGPTRTSRWIDDDVAELPDAWRVERTPDGFDLFLPDGSLLALLRLNHDQSWTLRPDYRSSDLLSPHLENRQIQLLDTSGQIRLFAPDKLSPLMLLILSLHPLAPLDRAALATWAEQNLADPAEFDD